VSFSKAQDAPDMIKMWQATYPHVELLSQETFQKLSEQERTILMKLPHIVFQNEISVHEINMYAEENGLLTISVQEKSTNNDAAMIKNWKHNNPHVKVVKRSDFVQMDESQQHKLIEQNNILILKSEVITAEDIETYNAKQ
jgi:hypothetical protein